MQHDLVFAMQAQISLPQPIDAVGIAGLSRPPSVTQLSEFGWR